MSETPMYESLTSGKMVKVFVGPKRKEWVLHEDLICSRSEFFRKAFQGGFQQAAEKEIHLKEDDPAAFCHFVEWLYGKTLRCCKKHQERVTWSHVEEWLRLYVFADKIGQETLKEEACKVYKDCRTTWLAEIEDIKFIYQNTPQYSEIRAWVCDEIRRFYLGKSFSDFSYWVKVTSCNGIFNLEFAAALKSHLVLS